MLGRSERTVKRWMLGHDVPGGEQVEELLVEMASKELDGHVDLLRAGIVGSTMAPLLSLPAVYGLAERRELVVAVLGECEYKRLTSGKRSPTLWRLRAVRDILGLPVCRLVTTVYDLPVGAAAAAFACGLLAEREAACFLGVTAEWLEQQRAAGWGPAWVATPTGPKYWAGDLVRWVRARTIRLDKSGIEDYIITMNMKTTRQRELFPTHPEVGGYSESAWKSLVVKATRIGWPSALYAAEDALGRSKTSSVIWTQVWEDIFPAPEDLPEVVAAISAGDWDAVCRWQTHHGRPGITDRWFALRNWGMGEAVQRPDLIRSVMRETYGVRTLPPRGLHCAAIWLRMVDELRGTGRKRDVLEAAFDGAIPPAVLDLHTHERTCGVSMLSGLWERHVELARFVQRWGWEPVRAAMLAGLTQLPKME